MLVTRGIAPPLLFSFTHVFTVYIKQHTHTYHTPHSNSFHEFTNIRLRHYNQNKLRETKVPPAPPPLRSAGYAPPHSPRLTRPASPAPASPAPHHHPLSRPRGYHRRLKLTPASQLSSPARPSPSAAGPSGTSPWSRTGRGARGSGRARR